MTAFAVAQLSNVSFGADIIEYLERIDATLEPFGGRFVVHGGELDRLEGDWIGDLIIIGFPDRERARAWYGSPAYRDILPLRTENSTAVVVLADGVPDDYRGEDALKK